MFFPFEELKKGCKNASLHSPCWLTAGKCSPSILLSHRTLERFVISGDTIFFLHDKALCSQSLPAWACKSLTVCLTKWAECDIAGEQSAAQHSHHQLLEELPAASPLTLRSSIQRRHTGYQAHNLIWWKWQEALLTHTLHSSECTWMLNYHLLFSLALLCQGTGHCLGKCDGSCGSEWKTLSLSHFMAAAEKQEPFQGLNCQEEERGHNFLQFMWILSLLCAVHWSPREKRLHMCHTGHPSELSALPNVQCGSIRAASGPTHLLTGITTKSIAF